MSQKPNWVSNPTKTQLITVLSVYGLSLFLILAVLTELFEKAMAFKENFMLVFLLIIATLAVTKISINYFKLK